MDILQPSLEQNPVFGTSGSGGSGMFLEWQYSIYKFFQWAGDVLAVVFSQGTWDIIKAVLSIISIFCITVMAYCAVRMFEIRAKERAHLHQEIEEYARNQAAREKEKRRIMELSSNPRWVNIINYLSSADSAQWKMAVLEADGMLDSLMDQLGYQGENLGEKLKTADPKKFRSLPAAWEAHTVRNRIAHEGSDFVLTSREAKRVISLYEEIFREFGFI